MRIERKARANLRELNKILKETEIYFLISIEDWN
jgi:hypothetical protein